MRRHAKRQILMNRPFERIKPPHQGDIPWMSIDQAQFARKLKRYQTGAADQPRAGDNRIKSLIARFRQNIFIPKIQAKILGFHFKEDRRPVFKNGNKVFPVRQGNRPDKNISISARLQ